MDIIENSEAFLGDFIKLNEEWISQYFELEKVDEELSLNPFKIVDDGGYIFSLIRNGQVLGVCALFNDGNGVFELARMAVSPKHHGNGFGNKLIEYSLAKLKEINAKKVYLVSNTKLDAAISLYKKYGFKTVFEGSHPVYTRANIIMELTAI